MVSSAPLEYNHLSFMSLSSGSRLGPYEVVAPVGAGGMGEVYRAHDSRLHREVAIKTLPSAFAEDPNRLARFQREAQALAALSHPNIAGIYGLEESGDTFALVMEFVDGPTLAERIAAGPIPVSEALTIVRQIGAALEAAHEKGIVHRDLKPANIMLRIDGDVKVLDFGLALLSRPSGALRECDETETQTVPGRIMGTLSYMSPEQARGEVVDARSDLWSLGVVLYECLAGRRPFEGASHSEVVAGILEREAPAVKSLNRAIPGRLSELIAKLLTKDPEQRLGPAGEVERRLKLLAESDAQRPARERRRR